MAESEFGFITRRDREQARRLARRVDALEGGGAGGGDGRRPRRPGGGDGNWQRITVIISGSTQDGSSKRWLYDWDEGYKESGGYGGWATLPGGLSSSILGYAYNRAEDINGASGTYGNGSDSADFVGTFDIQPVPDGYPAEAEIVYPADGSDPEVWINVPNGITGGCPS